MILYVNACVRRNSRTDELARYLLDILGDSYVERKLSREPLLPLSEERLEFRTKLIDSGNYSDRLFDYSKEFAAADIIVISAPFWDLSFPTLLKAYIENIYITGIVSRYNDDGTPKGLCRAKKLYYVTTAGGPYDARFSFDYIREMCVKYLGIAEVQLIKAEMLDIEGNNPTEILKKAKEELTSAL